MNRILTAILLLLFIPLFALAQNKASKKEIFEDWKADLKSLDTNEIKTYLGSEMIQVINNLKSRGIDTLGIYMEEYVGAEYFDSCLCGNIPWKSYVQWIKDGKKFNQEITGCCKSILTTVYYSPIIEYYLSNKHIIDNEIIMPVIISATKNRKGKIKEYKISSDDHTTIYTLYIEINGNHKFITFDQYQLDCELNLFNKENNNSCINAWRIQINQ